MNDHEDESPTAVAPEPAPPAPLPDEAPEAIDTRVLDEIEAASPPLPPAIDPWSRPATTVRSTLPAPSRPEAPPRPRGWEWSQTASADIAWAPSFPTDVLTAPAGAPVLAVDAFLPQPATAAGRIRLDSLALFMALFGGLLALVGAFFQEMQSGVGLFLLILAAPVIEEVLKPSGIYLLLVKWPQALRGQLHTALLCAISGAVFGVVESLVYVKLYYPDGSDAFVLFRFTVTPLMHAAASFIVGWGLSRGIVDWANGKSGLPKKTRNGYVLGIGLHAIYNTSVVILGMIGVLDFLETALFR